GYTVDHVEERYLTRREEFDEREREALERERGAVEVRERGKGSEERVEVGITARDGEENGNGEEDEFEQAQKEFKAGRNPGVKVIKKSQP
ncbi:MAG: hypothetical protein LQ340_005702, partial [Diploschistes diacapsis]